MSKYVRTADGVYDKGKFIKEAIPLSNEVANALGMEVHPVIKEADTIEELCDNFLVEYANGEHMMFHDFYHLRRHYELYSQDYHHVTGRYGCIWVVGKGLIYVAKLNAEGGLELI